METSNEDCYQRRKGVPSEPKKKSKKGKKL
jgi:hypothetical protein